jgi:2',3'-cyclic-nucleotide 2'-phosphodiesterase (5'-nucleotidase family)
MVDLARELPAGRVHLIVGGHDHAAGGGVVADVPIVRAGANGRGVSVVDLHRRRDGTHTFATTRVDVHTVPDAPRTAMDVLLAPHLRRADERGRATVTRLAERLSAEATGDRRLGTLIAEAIRLAASADMGWHNPGGVRADLPAGEITYADVHRVLPFDNAVVKLTLTGRELRRLFEQAGPRYYVSGVRVAFDTDAAGARTASLSLPGGGRVLDDGSYSVATNDYLADGGDNFLMLADMPREAIGISVLDAVVAHLRALPSPVRLRSP